MSPEIPRDAAGRVIRPRPSQLLADVMDALGPDHLTTRTLMAALIERDRGAGVEPRAVTPGYGWHLPVLADAPNVPYDMQESSLDIEATLTSHNQPITPAAGWANSGGSQPAVASVTKTGLVVLTGSLKPTADTAIAGLVLIGTIADADARPAATITPMTYAYGTTLTPVRLVIAPSGTIQAQSFSAYTVAAANGYITLNGVTFNAASY